MNHEYIDRNQIVDRYLMDKLRPDETEEFECHYMHCVRCQDELALGEKFSAGLLQAATEEASGQAMEGKPGLWQRYRRFTATPQFAVAASLLLLMSVIISTVSLRLASDQRNQQEQLAAQLQQLSAPHTNTRILVLSEVRSGGSPVGASENTFYPGAEPTWFVLAMVPSDFSFQRYRVALRDEKATTLWMADDLLINDNDELVVTVHSSLLKSGEFFLQVEGLRSDDSWTTAGNYAFRVTPP